MSSTVFIPNNTVIAASWLNDVNAAVYNVAGPTGGRPTTPRALGQIYFDTTLGLPVWCSQLTPIIWVNSAGIPV